MDVSEAVAARRSIRDFLADPVDDQLLRDLLERAARAPSGGNVQPWRIYVLNGSRMTDFLDFLSTQPDTEPSEYDVYPANLWEPHRTARFELGEQMYGLLDIPREDKAGRLQQFARNARFFDAPAAFFITIDRRFNASMVRPGNVPSNVHAAGSRGRSRYVCSGILVKPPWRSRGIRRRTRRRNVVLRNGNRLPKYRISRQWPRRRTTSARHLGNMGVTETRNFVQ